MVIKGYDIPYGYMGFIHGRYMLFATEEEYLEIVREENR